MPQDRPDDPEGLAAALVEAEEAVRTETDPELRAAWGQRQQLLYRLVAGEAENAELVVELANLEAGMGDQGSVGAVTDAGVFWPLSSDPLFGLVGTFPVPSSDHRLVWVDVKVR